MSVMPFASRALCPRCGLSADRPHDTERECIRAIDAEMRVVLNRSRALTRKRGVLLHDWLKTIRQGLRPAFQTDQEAESPILLPRGRKLEPASGARFGVQLP
jgi:hypothetical protein